MRQYFVLRPCGAKATLTDVCVRYYVGCTWAVVCFERMIVIKTVTHWAERIVTPL